ncbi:MAG: molybdopterin-dependent oxidoreductase, partial [Thermoflexales bacterium]|nr:molybdopterin-dependent oxidoreductase [Thermoflexales bacterium]
GCNIALNTRLETKTGGYEIKRVMPRQNERVNEVWICDKGRYVHHFTRAADRLTRPLIRRNGALVETSWQEALNVVAERIQSNAALVVGDRIPNEDAFLAARLAALAELAVGIRPEVAVNYADVARAFGVGKDADFKQLGKGDVIVVVNGDVEEEAPVWFLRLRQAVVDRGARLIVAHHRGTKMHRYAAQIYRYEVGHAAEWAARQPAEWLGQPRNALIVFGEEHLDGPSARALAQLLANALLAAGVAGKPNSGLLPLYPHANTQGVFDMLEPVLRPIEGRVNTLWLAGVGADEPVPGAGYVIVQDILMTERARRADLVLPALSFAEREGTFTSGDRRVQRFYRGLPPLGEAKPDWWVFAEVAKRLGARWSYTSPAAIFAEITRQVSRYSSLSYEAIGRSEPQWPPMGRADLYYGGTAYDNTGGLGARYPADVELQPLPPFEVNVPAPTLAGLERGPRLLYRDGELIRRSPVLRAHVIPQQAVPAL